MSQTGTQDEQYNLISVLYHALQGGDTVSKYMSDAQSDTELAQILQQAQGQYKQIADQAKQLLAQRMS
ncbi:hypothetical protein G3V76_23815 [Escherichia coli]|nr:hypothetical protein [Escherichia coli]